MLDPRFVYVSLVLNLIGSADYIRRILRGSVQPNRASWLLWTIAPAVVLAAELREGVGLQTVMTFAVTLGPFLVLVTSFTTKAAYWKLGPWDWGCGSLSGGAIALWAVTDSAELAIIFSVLADALAAAPTVRKAISHPHSENPFFFVLVSLGAGITLLTIRTWTFVSAAFPIYIFLFPAVLALTIWRQQAATPKTAGIGPVSQG